MCLLEQTTWTRAPEQPQQPHHHHLHMRTIQFHNIASGELIIREEDLLLYSYDFIHVYLFFTYLHSYGCVAMSIYRLMKEE